MSYRVIIPKPVQKQLDGLPEKQRERLLADIRLLADVPRPSGVKKLKGYENTYRTFMQKRLLSKSTGATVQHVNMKDIRELAMSELPSIQVQRASIKKLEQLRLKGDCLEAIYRQKIAALKELKQSILQKAFTGELTADTPKAAKEGIAA
jgi:rRNA-processing protein FCF1